MIQVPTNLQQAKDDLSRASLERRIPHKPHFTLGEACDLCQVRPDILRAWENQFSQLRSERRRANRRFFSREEVFFIYQIAYLVQQQGMSIPAARAWLDTNPHPQDTLAYNVPEPEARIKPVSSENKSPLSFVSFSENKSEKKVEIVSSIQPFSVPLTPTVPPAIPNPPTPKFPLTPATKVPHIHHALTEILSILNGKK